MRNNLDLSAYLVLGPENTLDRPVADIVAQAISAGFTCVQIRAKTASARAVIALTREVADVIALAGKSHTVALLVDDRLDVVLAAREQGIKVDGIHVGQSDIPVDVCRRYLGPNAVVGLSARTQALIDYVQTTDVRDIDYFGAGPLHETATKPDCGLDNQGQVITRSIEDIQALAACSPLPVVVGGGVKHDDIPALASTGIAGFFVVSAVAAAPNPYTAAQQLTTLWQRHRK